MSSTNKTPNYALPQFIPTDKPTWLGDVNAAMLAIDTAMADNHTTAESANTSASAAVAQVQHAVDTANEAKVDSAAALQNATNAIGVAQNALNSATQATQTAQAATQTANAANASAASAVATANQAKQTADATDAELTEFEHLFSVGIPNQADAAGYGIFANPAILNLTVGGGDITEAKKTGWVVNGQMFPVNSVYTLEINSELYLTIHPVENGKQTVEIASKSGTVTVLNTLNVFFGFTKGGVETLIQNNPDSTKIAPSPVRFIGCL